MVPHGIDRRSSVSLAKGASGDSDALLAANAQASIAVAESLHDVTELLNALLEKLDQVDSAVMLLVNKD